MKKTLLFAMMAAVLGFTACSKEELAQIETAQKKGMILHATVAQPEDTKATFTDNEGVWHFAFAEGDKIMVYNKVGDNASSDYTFTNNGTDFISTDAQPTAEPARWYAYYPSREVSLADQTGKWEDLANVYALFGSTPYGSNVTGKDGLAITMEPAKLAFLKIVNQKGSIDINVMSNINGENFWVNGLKVSGSSFSPTFVGSRQALLSATEVGTYYIAVPAGTALTVRDGKQIIKSTSKGLKAGKYYELAIYPFGQGEAEVKAEAGISGNKVKWIQLWENGPKFAEFNVGAKSITEYGGYYGWGGTKDKDMSNYWDGDNISGHDTAIQLWGDKWRMPTSAELQALFNKCSVEWTAIGGVNGLKFTGKDDYSVNSIFLPVAGYFDVNGLNGRHELFFTNKSGYYWTSSTQLSGGSIDPIKLYIKDNSYQTLTGATRHGGLSVRAVLAE
ncbi:MAG: fimbrillin family protein [Bacteroidaceae bacterium]|nr:fimbrillin family protein [Bacteroidaceae bacterium]